MEWTELQAMWQQYDARIVENTRINKEILKRMLRTKPERRVNWVMLQTGAGLLLGPIFVFIFFVLSPVKFNHGWPLYLGILLYGGGVLWGYYWSIKHLILLRKINFTHPVATTRKDLKQLEKYQTMRLRLGYGIMPIMMIGVFLIFDMPIFTKATVVPLSLIFAIMIVSMYYQFRWKSWWFKKLNTELDEIEQLEKE